MAPYGPEGWEPDERRLGNWRSMFEPPQLQAATQGSVAPGAEAAPPEFDDALVLDTAQYQPWLLQRIRNRIPAMIHLRRFEPKSDQWLGWMVPYPSLCAVDYVGDGLLTLDFGLRQFAVEGCGLDELARQLQQGTVLVVQEYCPGLWPEPPVGPAIRAIRRLGAPPGAPG